MTLRGRRTPQSEQVPNPANFLLLAIIHQAAHDLTGRGQGLTPLKIQTARNFIQSQLFLNICNHVGLQPSFARALVKKAAHGRLTPIRSRNGHSPNAVASHSRPQKPPEQPETAETTTTGVKPC